MGQESHPQVQIARLAALDAAAAKPGQPDARPVFQPLRDRDLDRLVPGDLPLAATRRAHRQHRAATAVRRRGRGHPAAPAARAAELAAGEPHTALPTRHQSLEGQREFMLGVLAGLGAAGLGADASPAEWSASEKLAEEVAELLAAGRGTAEAGPRMLPGGLPIL